MREWSKQYPWQLTVLVWISGVILVLLIQVLLSHLNGWSIDWAEALGLALIIPSVGIVGLIPWVHQRRQRAGMDRTP